MQATRPIYLLAVAAAAVLLIVLVVLRGGREQSSEVVAMRDPRLLSVSSTEEVSMNRNDGNGRPKIEVYYETQCPDSTGFELRTLSVLYRHGFFAHADVELIPSGKVTKDSHGENICQHGASECHLNKAANCALKLHPALDDYWPFMECIASRARVSDEAATIVKCAKAAFQESDVFMACVDGPDGDTLAEAARVRTAALEPRLFWVPWVTVNGLPIPQQEHLVHWFACVAMAPENRPSACYKSIEQLRRMVQQTTS